LKRGETKEHNQTTMQLQIDYTTFKNLAQQSIKVDLDDAKN